MRSKRRLILLVTAVALVAGFLGITTPAFGVRRENVLYRFCGPSGDCSNGGEPNGVIFGEDGNLYGTASYGGNFGLPAGVAFELKRGAHSTWTETVLYDFCSAQNCTDGSQPEAGLIFDAAGNLYGTTYEGGDVGYGTVFELSPGTNGSWTETVLHSFGAGNDGILPTAGVIFDSSGNLYGTTSSGGIHERGTVFELTPGANGKWTEKVLHSFESPGDIQDGPAGGVVFDAAGNLYGTTYGGGIVSNNCASNYTFGCGRVFELTPEADGKWKEITLHRFNSKDGANPLAGVIVDAAGNLYGTTFYGGAGHCQDGCGVVFRLSPDKNGKWTEKVIHDFGVRNGDGYEPEASLTFDSDGNLYGTASDEFFGRGTVFELMPNANGTWTEKTVHKWGTCEYGCDPNSPVIFDASGNLYGTTPIGGCLGSGQCLGTVFEVTAKP